MEAIEKAELARMSEEAQATYYAGLKTYRDNISQMNTARSEGIEEGIKIGEQKTKEREKNAKIEIAKNCLEDGMSIPKIAKLTGLTEDEIRHIRL